MSGTNTTVNSVKGTSTLVRARFGPGMLLQHEDLDQLNVYTRELSRLMFRSLFGCGVICGLVVTTETKCGKVYVTVGAGLALDGNGDPIYLPKDQTLPIDENCDPNLSGPLWVVLCGNTKCCAPRTAICSSDDDESPSVCTRERDGYEIRIVRERPRCICGCPEPENNAAGRLRDDDCKCVDPELPCYVDHYDGKCGCCSDDSSGSDCNCNCECVLLASLKKIEDPAKSGWTVDHRVRRFVRPVLMRDPQVEKEEQARTTIQAPAPPPQPPPAQTTPPPPSTKPPAPTPPTAGQPVSPALPAPTPKPQEPFAGITATNDVVEKAAATPAAMDAEEGQAKATKPARPRRQQRSGP